MKSELERAIMGTAERQHHFHPLTFVSHHGITMFVIGAAIGFSLATYLILRRDLRVISAMLGES